MGNRPIEASIMSRALITTSSVRASDVSSMAELQIVGIKYRPSNSQLVYILYFFDILAILDPYLRHLNHRSSSASKDIGLTGANASLPLSVVRNHPPRQWNRFPRTAYAQSRAFPRLWHYSTHCPRQLCF